MNDRASSPRLRYKGSLKHKLWVPGGGFGTLCPSWTHRADGRDFAGDPERHPWSRTKAQALLTSSVDAGSGRRYAAEEGIAFVALLSFDGTWHGYPIPWHDVPASIQDQLVEKGQVTRNQIRRQRRLDTRGVRWALSTDED